VSSDELRIRDVWRSIGGDAETVDDLLARHREPHRRYHSVRHVAFVIDAVDELLAASDVAAGDRAVVRLAALFHDVVYDPRRSDNEARSAELAAAAARRLGWADGEVRRVEELVLATAAHDAGGATVGDPGRQALLDADLSILGAEPPVYDAYVTGVRQEYAHVDDAGWRAGRAAVLRSFLDRERIYSTTLMHDRAERRARANLTAELAALR
jgi:predicted metal-dependent HD superfamily phosphohydrolase